MEDTVKILKEKTYRSTPFVNITDDMVMVTFVTTRRQWRSIKRCIMNKNKIDEVYSK